MQCGLHDTCTWVRAAADMQRREVDEVWRSGGRLHLLRIAGTPEGYGNAGGAGLYPAGLQYPGAWRALGGGGGGPGKGGGGG